MNTQAEIKKVLSDLVSIKTITGNKSAILESFLYIKNYLKDTPVYIKEYTNSAYPFMYVSTKKNKSPDILLAAHMDVVSGGDNLFTLRQKKGTYIGRGVFDMKFAIAIYLVIFRNLFQKVKDKNIAFLVTSDEEIGGINGTKKFLDFGFKPKAAFLPDGGTDWDWEEKGKGVWQFNVKVRGVSAHGSRVWLGKNAIQILNNFSQEVDLLFQSYKKSDKKRWYSTCNLGKMSGGTTINSVPDYAEASFDVRFISTKEGLELKKKVQKISKAYSCLTIEDLIFEPASSFTISSSHKLFIGITKKYNIKSAPCISHGASDARFFSQKKIDCIVTRPKGGDIHSDNEWIDIKDLTRFFEVVNEFVTSSN